MSIIYICDGCGLDMGAQSSQVSIAVEDEKEFRERVQKEAMIMHSLGISNLKRYDLCPTCLEGLRRIVSNPKQWGLK